VAGPGILIRPPDEGEIDQLATIWRDAWHKAHAHLMPPGLTSARTLANFAARLPPLFPDTRVAGSRGAPLGFCILKGDAVFAVEVMRYEKQLDG
jgi:hypothetical protein